jgi:hypothetical protein
VVLEVDSAEVGSAADSAVDWEAEEELEEVFSGCGMGSVECGISLIEMRSTKSV